MIEYHFYVFSHYIMKKIWHLLSKMHAFIEHLADVPIQSDLNENWNK